MIRRKVILTVFLCLIVAGIATSAPAPPVASFNSVVPFTVTFTDESTGDPTSWLWDFGDGYTSTERNPVHSYMSAGNYTVNLTVSNGVKSVSKVRPVYVSVAGECYGADCNPTGEPIGGGAGYSKTADTLAITEIVTNKEELLVALGNATSGDVVFVPGGTNIDMNGTANVAIPQGVTLAGDRGYQGSRGALINKTINSTAGWIESMFIMRDNSRITGLWLQGEMRAMGDTNLSDRWYTTAIRPSDPETTNVHYEVDNNEIEGWSLSGIQAGTSSALGGTGNIHHNYIHGNHAMWEGCGIAVVDGNALIEANLFDDNRHSVAGGGYPNESYVARYNVELDHDYSAEHMFDVHEGLTGGNWYNISYNTFQNALSTQEYIHYRGKSPGVGVWIYNNEFDWDSSWSTLPVKSEVNETGKSRTHIMNNYVGNALHGGADNVVSFGG